MDQRRALSPRSRFAAVACAAIFALLGASCGNDGSPATTGPTTTVDTTSVPGRVPTAAGSVADVRSIDYVGDPLGREFAFRAPEGGLLLVYFGYLQCPDICPLTMVDTANGIRELGEDGDRVEVALVSVDIERDLGQNLRNYLSHFFPDGGAHGIRAPDDAALLNLAYRFGVTYTVDPHEPGTRYGVAHTGDTFVVNDQGELIWSWPFGTKGPAIAEALRALLPAAA